MRLSGEEVRKLLVPAIACALLAAAGAGLIWGARKSLVAAKAQLAAAQKMRSENQAKLARIAEEEREVKEKLKVYQRLRAVHILGPERRLEWADAISRIRTDRDLLDLKYRVDPQKKIATVPGKPGPVDFYTSTMHVELALLHEGDLLRFLSDLRRSGNAYYSVRSCTIVRVSESAAGGIAPRLKASCDIDLDTIVDHAAKAS